MSAEKLKPKLIKKAQPQVNESKFEENGSNVAVGG
jgi:hypothetical protein